MKTKRFLMQNFLLRHRFAVTFFAGICIGTGYANIAYRYQAALPEIYNQHYLSAYADITMNYYALWKYIIRYRFRDLLLIGMMGLTAFRKYLIITDWQESDCIWRRLCRSIFCMEQRCIFCTKCFMFII